MTRLLTELLGVDELALKRGISQLEAASGHASTDIRLSSDIQRKVGEKLKLLGLDPTDTTGEELYAALQQKVLQDDLRLQHALKQQYGEQNTSKAIVKVLEDLPLQKSCFALKASIGKRLLQKMPPKQAMKSLGYRSLDSMMRREPLAASFAAAWLVESNTWCKAMLDSYRRLSALDFESRELTFLSPQSTHWQRLAEIAINKKKHTIIGLKEIGAVLVLPFAGQEPPAASMATLLLALHEVNEIRATSAFLKLCQVRPDFGMQVRLAVTGEPVLYTDLVTGPLPWEVIQRYYARSSDHFRPEIFEPHIQREDLTWHPIEKVLASLDASLSFWRHTAHLGMSAQAQPVSLNILDAVLNYCNQLPYSQRIVHYFRNNLWHELLIRYLHHDNVEQAVLSSLESQLVEEPALL